MYNLNKSWRQDNVDIEKAPSSVTEYFVVEKSKYLSRSLLGFQ